MAYRINTLQTSGAGQVGSLSFAGKVKKNFLAIGLLLRIIYPLTVTYDGTHANTIPSDVQIMDAAFASLTLRYGRNGDHVPYPTIKGSELRTIHRYIMRQGIFSNGSTFSAGMMTGNYSYQVDVYIPFQVPSLSGGRKRAVGWGQLDTFQLDVVEGAAINTANSGSSVVRQNSAFVNTEVSVLGYASTDDQWSPVLSYGRFIASGLSLDAAQGAHVAAWDVNASEDSTALDLVSVGVDDSDLHANIPPYIIADDYEDLYLSPASIDGSADVTDTVTMLLSAHDGQAVDELPHGKLHVSQADEYVEQLKVNEIYWPALSPNEANEATTLKAEKEGQAVMATTSDEVAKPTLAHAAVAPIRFTRASDPDFTLKTGLMAKPGDTQAQVSIPEHVAQAHAASVAVAAQSGTATAVAAQAKSLNTLAKAIPGFAAKAFPAVKGSTSSVAQVQNLSSAMLAGANPQSHGLLSSLFGKLKLF